MTDDRDAEDATDGDEETDPDDDPFDQFEADVGDREGDPFERLPTETGAGSEDDAKDVSGPGGPGQDGTGPGGPGQDGTGPGGSGHDATEPGEPAGEKPGGGPAPNTSSVDDDSPGSREDDGTGSGMTFDVGQSGPGSEEREAFVDDTQREGDPFESLGGAFEEMDVGAVDPETVWQDLSSAQSRGSVGDPARRTYAEVSKHSYCEQCEFFSGPPDIACQHEGTEIVEFLDMETVRVVDCPIVAERTELQAERSVARREEDER